MKIYIASSWKNQHGVEMLTFFLRQQNHSVISWIENCNEEGFAGFDFEKWMKTEAADRSFVFDTDGATKCDILIYYGPSGKDACAELGAAWAKGIPIIGLYAKGEDLGLMRKMMLTWTNKYTEVLELIKQMDLLKQQS